VIGLCFGVDPVEVCIAFLPHLERDRTIALTAPDPVIGCLVAIVFFALGRDAVFTVIDRDHYRVAPAGAGPSAPALSRVVDGLAADPAGRIDRFARFLIATFEALAALPQQIGPPISDHLVACVERWCRDAVRTAQTEPPLAALLRRLRADPHAPLGRAVTDLLRSEDFRKRDSPLQALAVDVLTTSDPAEPVDHTTTLTAPAPGSSRSRSPSRSTP